MSEGSERCCCACCSVLGKRAQPNRQQSKTGGGGGERILPTATRTQRCLTVPPSAVCHNSTGEQSAPRACGRGRAAGGELRGAEHRATRRIGAAAAWAASCEVRVRGEANQAACWQDASPSSLRGHLTEIKTRWVELRGWVSGRMGSGAYRVGSVMPWSYIALSNQQCSRVAVGVGGAQPRALICF